MIATNNYSRKMQRVLDIRCHHAEQTIRDRFLKDNEWNQQKARLSRVNAIQDDDLVERMLKVGINSENVSVLHKFPVAMAGWAHGSISMQEAHAAFEETFTRELSGRKSEMKLFISWLIKKPSLEIWQIWHDYVRIRIQVIGLRHTQTIGRSIYRLTEKVAMHSGGFCGYATICREEQEVLKRIKKCYFLE